MNCQCFEQRFNELLDQRADVLDDDLLSNHAAACSQCNATMETWAQIERGFQGCQEHPTTTIQKTAREHTAWWSSALAASVLMVTVGGLLTSSSPITGGQSGLEKTSPAGPTQLPEATTGLPAYAATDSVDHSHHSSWAQTPWWSAVQEEQWVRKTIPAVDSMRESIAPIGRSMRQAMAILMNAPMAQDLETLPPESPAMAPQQNHSPAQEQTHHRPSLGAGEKMA